MSYSLLKRKGGEFDNIFSNAKLKIIKNVANPNLNLILSSESFVSKLKPILEEMLQDELDDKKVVLIPNAGFGMDKIQMSYQYLEEFTTINNMYLKQLDLERWPTDILIQALESCDVLSISGGLVSRLIQSIDKANLREKIITIISSGKPTIAFSAGAMSMSRSTIFAQNFIGEPDPEASKVDPLGIVEFEIYPHYQPDIFSKVARLAVNLEESFGVEASQALFLTKGKLWEVGEVTKFGGSKA